MSTGSSGGVPLSTPRDLARAISVVERGGSPADDLMRRLGARRPRGWVLGMTGPPGAGKSTLVDRLIAVARRHDLTVGVIAADPSSPFSGGALLGDRIRMIGHSGDSGVFIRSMAARDNLGGLTAATRDVVRLMDAYGLDLIMLETVGIGQSELDIVRVADSVAVVVVPGLGDGVQAIKAGVLEIADVFVVNMADRPGADRAVLDLRTMLSIGPPRAWTPEIVETVAIDGRGIEDAWHALGRHRAHLESSGELRARRTRRVEAEVFELVDRELRRRVRNGVRGNGAAADVLAAARDGAVDPRTAAAEIISATLDRPAPRSRRRVAAPNR